MDRSRLGWLTGIASLNFGGLLAMARIERALDFIREVGLDHRHSQRSGSLCVGERQPVAITRALVNDPRLLLADEPTETLDSTNQTQTLKLLAGLKTPRNLTMILTTHNAEVARTADRVIRLLDGRIVNA